MAHSDAPPTLMLFGAHHDDNELMAGTIAQHRQKGWRVVSVVATAGRFSLGEVNDRCIAIRNNESVAAAKLLGVETVFLDFPEGHFRADDQTRLAFVKQIRQHRPAAIITHPPRDYHNDHEQVSRCTYEAVHLSWNPTYDADGVVVCPLPHLYYSDAWFVPFEPDVYVDVSEWIDLKRQALACHKSQLDPGGPKPGDMIDMENLRARHRGVEAGCLYAEAFRHVPFLGRQLMATLLA